MLIYTLLNFIINLFSTLLSPFSLVTSHIYNLWENTQFYYILKVVRFFIPSTTIMFYLSSFAFWTGIFIIRPVINLIRNKG